MYAVDLNSQSGNFFIPIHLRYFVALYNCLYTWTIFLKCIVYMQPMTLEQLLSDRDSEDEHDDRVIDFEDRRVQTLFTISLLFIILLSVGTP